MIISTEKGRRIDAPVNWVYFTLNNTDIVAQIQKGPLRIKKIDKNHFRGKFLNVNVTLEILGDKQPLSEGEIHIAVDARLPTGFGRTNTIAHYRYQAIEDKSTIVDLRFHLETSGIIMFFYYLIVKYKIDSYLSNVLQEVEKVSQLLCSNSDILKIHLTDEQLDRISRFRLIHKNFPICSKPKLNKESQLDNDNLIWNEELLELTDLHSNFEDMETKLETELNRIKSARDEVLVLISARRVLESIVIQLCERFLKRDRGTEPLANIIDKLDKLEDLPDYLFNSMRNLNRLCNQAAHIKDFSSWQVKEALSSLCSIMHWYTSEWASICSIPDIKLHKINKDKYKAICRGVFADNLLTKEENGILKQARIELDISEEDAKKIESKFISENTQYQKDVAINQFKTALEAVYAGGKVNEGAREYINKKIEDLELSPEKAKQIEEEYLKNQNK